MGRQDRDCFKNLGSVCCQTLNALVRTCFRRREQEGAPTEFRLCTSCILSLILVAAFLNISDYTRVFLSLNLFLAVPSSFISTPWL